MLERQYLQSSGRIDKAGIEIVADATKVQATHARERNVPGARTDVRLERNQRGSAFELGANDTARLWPVESPPRFGRAHMRRRERADLDG